MATKSFLTEEDLAQAARKLRAPQRPPDGDERKVADFGSREFSIWLGKRLEERLAKHPDWQRSHPVALGSWARGELTPKSDIDILFCGPEENVKTLTSDFAREGVKLRYRVPEDPADWTKGVEPFDVLALHMAMPFTPEAEEKLGAQIDLLRARNQAFRKDLLKAMREERAARAERYDSISNFLEPNLKFGPGGLRDLEQALVTRQLFGDRFGSEQCRHAFEVLGYYKAFFLLVRQKLQLIAPGGGDILSAHEQKPISDWLGFIDPKDFMREIQKGVSRVSFYADWVIEQASRPMARLKAVDAEKLVTPVQLLAVLERDPSILMQNRIRLAADTAFKGARGDKVFWRAVGKRLAALLDPLKPETAMVALFRSRLIDHLVPDFRRIVGHVQHDQYHRFSVDAHLLQALRELKRLCRNPKLAGKLGGVVKSLSASERMILAFSCLYHDIAKGRGGDHSHKGIEIAKRDLERFGFGATMIREICWIVEEHLALSAAAFRENPRSPKTWRGLADKGVSGRRLALLAVFTIVDIRATNPEAWTPWKERLLFELVTQLERPETDSMVHFAQALRNAKVKWDDTWDDAILETLDPFLVGALPPKLLAEDLKSVAESKTEAEGAPRVVQLRGGKQTWVRFHSQRDLPGLFFRYVNRLAAVGLSVRHASVHTHPEIGVYDWFEVKSSRSASQIAKMLAAAKDPSGGGAPGKVRFDAVELVTSDPSEWVISFRGRDQQGALAEAARALFEEGAEIHWAKVHTWGRQIDDVFGIAPRDREASGGTADALLERLRQRLGQAEPPDKAAKV